ncbi:hypothetical protein D3C71_1929880 [compost metagenome]
MISTNRSIYCTYFNDGTFRSQVAVKYGETASFGVRVIDFMNYGSILDFMSGYVLG